MKKALSDVMSPVLSVIVWMCAMCLACAAMLACLGLVGRAMAFCMGA